MGRISITGSLILGCLLVLLLLSACGPGAAASTLPTATPTMDMPMPSPSSGSGAVSVTPTDEPITGPHVVIDNFSFNPQVITITVGTTLTWVNQDDTPHTVSSTDKVFTSGALDTGDRFTYHFTTPGTYKYYCMIHPKMTATVVVQ